MSDVPGSEVRMTYFSFDFAANLALLDTFTRENRIF